ncbi:hypothetical protein ACOMHN_061420 [Nucella lapillus]
MKEYYHNRHRNRSTDRQTDKMKEYYHNRHRNRSTDRQTDKMKEYYHNRHRNRSTDRQTDKMKEYYHNRHRNRSTDRQTDKMKEYYHNRHRNRSTDRQTDKMKEYYHNRHRNRSTDRQTDKMKEYYHKRHRNRSTDRQTDKMKEYYHNRHRNRRTDRQTDKMKEYYHNRHRNRSTDRQTDKMKEYYHNRHRNRRTDRQTDKMKEYYHNRHRNRSTDRQTDKMKEYYHNRHRNRSTDRQTDKMKEYYHNRHRNRSTDRQTDKMKEYYHNRHRNRSTDRQTDKMKEYYHNRHRNRSTDRQTDKMKEYYHNRNRNRSTDRQTDKMKEYYHNRHRNRSTDRQTDKMKEYYHNRHRNRSTDRQTDKMKEYYHNRHRNRSTDRQTDKMKEYYHNRHRNRSTDRQTDKMKEYYHNSKLRVHRQAQAALPCGVVLGTVISHVVKLEETYDVKTVGDVPLGIPAPKVQQFTYLSDVLSDAIAIGIVAFAISVSMAKILAKKHDYDIDPDQELLAYGTMNVTCSFFSSFCAAASLSRTLVMENVGCKTQVTGLVSSALLLVVLLVLGTYFRTLPNCVLAAIIMVALKGMFKQFAELKRLWNISLIDFAVWLVAFLATVLLDVDLGLLAAILFALLTVIIRNQRPYVCLLGQVPGTDLYRDVGVVKAAKELEHIKIFRFDSALFFANSENFKRSIYKLTADPTVLKKLKRRAEKELFNIHISSLPKKARKPKTLDQSPAENPDHKAKESVPPTEGRKTSSADNASQPLEPARKISEASSAKLRDNRVAVVLPTVTDVYFIIVDCTAMSYVDSVGVKVLQQVITEMRHFSIQVFLAHCKDAVREMFEKTDFYRTSDKQCLFLTVHDAVLNSQRLLAVAVGGDESRSEISRKSSLPGSIDGDQTYGTADRVGDNCAAVDGSNVVFYPPDSESTKM